jgi:hypothetical protein
MSQTKHNPDSYYCQCAACWRADIDDETQRRKSREDAVIKEAAAIIKKRKNIESPEKRCADCYVDHLPNDYHAGDSRKG